MQAAVFASGVWLESTVQPDVREGRLNVNDSMHEWEAVMMS